MEVPEYLQPYWRWIIKNKPWSFVGIGAALLCLAGGTIWYMIPSTQSQTKKVWQQVSGVGQEKQGEVSPTPTASATPLSTADPSTITGLSKRIDDLEVGQINQDVTLQETKNSLNDAIDLLQATTDSLMSREDEWLATLKRISSLTGISTSATSTAATGTTGSGSTVTPTATPVSTTSVSGKTNINTATAAQLDELPSIGATYAQRIIDYRTQNGPFKAIDEIKNVSGIGDSTYEKIKDLITV